MMRGIHSAGRTAHARAVGAVFLLGFVSFHAALGQTPPGERRPGSSPDRLLRETEAFLESRIDPARLPDTLIFELFDHPYTRATLAMLCKTHRVLRRELRLRERGHAAIPEDTLRSMMRWVRDARGRVERGEDRPPFVSYRVPLSRRSILAPDGPPLFAVADAATATRLDPRWGDLDVLAAMGFRVIALGPWPRRSRGDADLLARRAEALGVTVFHLPASSTAGGTNAPAAGQRPEPTAPLHPATLRDLVTGGSRHGAPVTGTIVLSDPAPPEPLACAWARRALARGLSPSGRYIVDGWGLMRDRADPAAFRGQAVVPLMWADAVNGLSLGILHGWRDLRDGSGSPHPSLLTAPD
ncbi:MAG: hypothetical protein D6788_01550, partial [Planctomycetota bacterium]